MRRPFFLLVLTVAVLVGSGCRRADEGMGPGRFPPAPSAGALTVMSYNLDGFRYADRNADGQANNFKPEEQIAALVAVIAAARPDVVLVQEIGDAASLTLLRDRLADAGLSLRHLDHLPATAGPASLGLLSRHPILERAPETNLTYSIRRESYPVRRGFQQVDLDVPGWGPVRLVHVHLKSKTFHEAGHTEMRRNEARLLATHLRRLQRAEPDRPLLLCGDFSDTENSAAVREVIGQTADIQALPLADQHGDAWTRYSAAESGWFRHHFIMANTPARERLRENESGVIRDRMAAAASDHRPLVAVFTAKAP